MVSCSRVGWRKLLMEFQVVDYNVCLQGYLGLVCLQVTLKSLLKYMRGSELLGGGCTGDDKEQI